MKFLGLWSPGLQNFFEKFVKPSGPSSYILNVRSLKKDLSSVKNKLMFKLKWIDFHHVCNLFLVGNDKSISKHQNIKDKKHCKLSNSVVVADVSHDPE